MQVPAASPNSFIQENAQLFKGLFQLALTEGDLSTLFDSHLRPFLDSFLRSEHDANTSNRLHAGDQERNHALASEIMAGMFRCLKYAGIISNTAGIAKNTAHLGCRAKLC